MRILTWNVNGIKTLPLYSPCVTALFSLNQDIGGLAHSWNGFSNDPYPIEGILRLLNADIICFQETKITRDKVDRALACPPNYDAFFSSNRSKPPRGYSGTCIYTRREACVPTKAEEGITGVLQHDDNIAERIGSYPTTSEIDLTYAQVRELDAEGRTTVVDLGLFVLFALYCPNQTNDERLTFKNNFDDALEARVRQLIRDGREVMLVGDINICAQPIDHCEPHKRAKDHGLADFGDHSSRRWFNDFIGPNGVMIDLCRHFYPNRKGMFTCWETKISARETNFGTRIDYVLVTPGLMPWVKHANIQPEIKGSDHCPVYVDLHDEIVDANGERHHLWEHINPPARVALQGEARAAFPPPTFAARNYKEFSHKLLSSFFVPRASSASPSLATPSIPPALADPTPSPPELTLQSAMSALNSIPAPDESTPEPSTSRLPPSLPPSRSPSIPIPVAGPSKPAKVAATKKPAPAPSVSSSTNGKGKGKAVANDGEGQTSISSFFAKPSKPKSTPTSSSSKRKAPSSINGSTTATKQSNGKGKAKAKEEVVIEDDQDEAEEEFHYDPKDYLDSEGPPPPPTDAWNSLFKAPPVPKCEGHNEPCKQWTVNKPGPNKGRVFWLCARPVGEGYDRGQSKILVNPEYRCNHFQWAINVKRPAVTASTSESGRIKKRPKTVD